MSEPDKQKLADILAQRLRQEAIGLFEKRTPAGWFVAPESVSVKLETLTYDKLVDEPTDLLTLEAHATARGLLVDGADANIVTLGQLQSKLRTNFELIADTVVYTPGAILAVEANQVRFQMKATCHPRSEISSASRSAAPQTCR